MEILVSQQLFPFVLRVNICSGPSGVYTVGASPSGGDGGALIVDEPNASGHFATFAAGTYSGAGIEGSNGDIDVGLIAPFSFSDGFHANAAGVGVLTFNPSTGAGKVTLPDGFVVPIPAGIAANITDPVEAPGPGIARLSITVGGFDIRISIGSREF